MSSESGIKAIIAMKGHPFTRKTQFATQIAASLRCPLLSLDHFLDVHISDSFQTSHSSKQPIDLAFGIICQIARYNLSRGYFQNVVIDSRLSSRSHFVQLIEMVSSLGQARLVIVECKTRNLYEWETRFKYHLQPRGRNPNTTPNKWYKAKNWGDIEKAIRDSYDERSDGYKLSKLVFDPISDYQNYGGDTPPFVDAVQYMISLNKGDGPDLVVYHRWLHSQHLPSCTRCHYIINYTEEGLDYNAMCMACDEQVKGPAYRCKDCSLALHKECAELLDKKQNQSQLRFRCRSCEENDTLSDSCGDCIFTTHLKRRLIPTVIRHACDEHFLSVELSELNPYGKYCQCKACGGDIRSVWYSCKTCGVAYHYKCLTELPLRVEHEHGLHHHHMELQFSSKDAEGYLCDVCFERGQEGRRDPRLWFYSCGKCPYHAHLSCTRDGYFLAQ